MNKVFLLGRMVKDVEVVQAKSGTPIANFTLAINRGKDDAEFVRCVAFGTQAGLIAEYVRKGNQLCLEGRLQTSRYEKEGMPMSSTEVIVESFHFVDRKETVTEEVKPKTNGYRRY